MDILRFITAGNVDDGKSTLIGRLLYDTGNIMSDVLATFSGDDSLNLAHITDGLRAERQQGITIDVAYKYFTTEDRKYIIADAPGHFQYTKNLVTGASGVDAVIILIDARNGITAQTKRHSLVAAFIKKRNIVVAINKMDFSGFSEDLYTTIRNEFKSIADILHLPDVTYIPMSALLGDNVISPSINMPWFKGSTLLQYLDNCLPEQPIDNIFRFTTQYVTSDTSTQYCAGKICAGFVSAGDTILVSPSGETGVVRMITIGSRSIDIAYAGQSVCLFIVCNEPINRGDIISELHDAPTISNTIDARICWLDETPLTEGKEYFLQLNSMDTLCRIEKIISKTSLESLSEYEGSTFVEMNEFATITIKTHNPIVFDSFERIPPMGRGILIDEETNYTSGAVVII